MKKSNIILIIMAIVYILCTGCSNKKLGKTVNDVLKEYKYNTECIYSAANFFDDNDLFNKYGIEHWYSSVEIAYNDLDDEISTVYSYNNFEFTDWKKAKDYYDNNIAEWKETKQEVELSEENIETESTGEITVTKLGKEKRTPRSIIEEQKEVGYTCKTIKTNDKK